MPNFWSDNLAFTVMKLFLCLSSLCWVKFLPEGVNKNTRIPIEKEIDPPPLQFSEVISITTKLFLVDGCFKFQLTLMGVLASGSMHTRPSAQPLIDASGNFPSHVSAQ